MEHSLTISRILTVEDFHKFKSHLDDFKRIYESEFPDENEREPLEYIFNRVQGIRNENDPYTFILLCHYNNEDKIIGGAIADYYLTSNCVHVTYVFIDSKSRRIGAWKVIRENLLQSIKLLEEMYRVRFHFIFFESNIPEKTSNETDSMDPALRLKVFSRTNARLIDIPYVQPSLASNLNDVHNLYLLCIPLEEPSIDYINCEVLIRFLADLYRSLGINDPNKSESFARMKSEIYRLEVNGDIILYRLRDYISQE